MIESSEANVNRQANPADNLENQDQGKEPGQSSGSKLEELEKRVQELEGQLKEKENKYVYLYADFENFKRRSVKERSDLAKFGWEPVARDLLQVVDNLERAVTHIPGHVDKNLSEGLQMVLAQFKSTLQKQGVQEIESLQKDFDPNLHEAVGQEESEVPSGKILKEFGKGYTLHGRLLRPARVVVSSGQALNAKTAT